MPASYFRKEIPTRKLFLPTGQCAPFEHCDLDYGFLRTEDPALIAELEKTVGRLGVLRSNEAEWLEFQKKKSVTPLENFLRQERESISAQSIPILRTSMAGAAAAMSAGPEGRAVGPTRNRTPIPPVAQAAPGEKVAPLEVPIAFPKLGKAKL